MAELIEIEETEVAKEEFSDLPTEPTQAEQPAQEPVEAPQKEVDNSTTEEVIPDKYQGKSVQELVEMHQNAEKALGKQGGEVGELRKLVDEYIEAQAPAQQPTQTTEPKEEIDFYTQPEKAVESAIDNHPAIKEAKEASQQMKIETARTQLLTKYPDITQTLQDEKFAAYVQDSPYRKRLFVNAEVNMDLEALDELMSGWQEKQSFVSNTVETETAARKGTVKDASTGNTSSTTGGSRKPIFRRADIIKLITEDPDRYEAMSEEIQQAYLEKRVR